LRKRLPEYMVPGQFGLLDRLPTTVSGKLNRRELPTLVVEEARPGGRFVAPRGPVEGKVASAFQRILNLPSVSVAPGFFTDLGGDSLRAAGASSLLREDPATAALTVRDLYEARTAAGLAKRARPVTPPPAPALPLAPTTRRGRPVLATAVQTAWLLLGLI